MADQNKFAQDAMPYMDQLYSHALRLAKNPADAEEGTIRKLYAESIEANSVHGSDSLENARIEIDFFFGADEIVG